MGNLSEVFDQLVEPSGSRFRDHLDPKVVDWIQSVHSRNNQMEAHFALHNTQPGSQVPVFDVGLLGAPLSKTSISHSAAFRLPDAIRSAFQALTPYNLYHDIDLSQVLSLIDFGNVRTHITDLQTCQEHIEQAVKTYWQTTCAPLILLGGDHSITGASVLGLVEATKKRYGIIHFDAHHDVRNLEDGGRSNGTPFRTILSKHAVVGNRIVQIGLRDFANAKAYRDYVVEQGVTVIPARTVAKEGLLEIVKHAVEIVSQDTDGFYVSFDMDVLDQCFVPGVPAPGPGGLTVWDAIAAMEYLGMQQKVVMLDIVCADPAQDVRDLTTRVAANLVLSFLTGVALRKTSQIVPDRLE